MGPMIMPPPMPSMPDSTPAPTDATDNSAQVRAVHGMSPSANAYPRATLRWCPRWLRPVQSVSQWSQQATEWKGITSCACSLTDLLILLTLLTLLAYLVLTY